MCRNIKVLYNFDPPATDHEIRGAALQFVRKVSGFTKPSKANEEVFNRAVEEVAAAARALLGSLVTTAEPRDREVEAQRARARALQRFGPPEHDAHAEAHLRGEAHSHGPHPEPAPG